MNPSRPVRWRVDEARLLAEAADVADAVCARVELMATASETFSLLLLAAKDHRDALISLRFRSGMPADVACRRLAEADAVLEELRDIAAAATEQYREALRSHRRRPRRHGNDGPPRIRRGPSPPAPCA